MILNLNLKNYLFGLLIITGLTSCSVLGTQPRDWNFVQAVGGIKIEKPIDTYEGWYMPIKLNVTGLEKITVQPTTMNSALECAKINVDKKDTIINITIRTGLVGLYSGNRASKAVNIGQLNKGKYLVYYKFKSDLNLIDSFEIYEDQFFNMKAK